MGNQVSDRVRLKCIELLYGWSQLLSHEPKVKEAYQMLKKQGIIKYDPVHVDKVGHNSCLSLCPILDKKKNTENHKYGIVLVCLCSYDNMALCKLLLLLLLLKLSYCHERVLQQLAVVVFVPLNHSKVVYMTLAFLFFFGPFWSTIIYSCDILLTRP